MGAFDSFNAVKSDPGFRPRAHIGCYLSHPTGAYVKGIYGESRLNGGLGQLSLILAGGNAFKTTTGQALLASAARNYVIPEKVLREKKKYDNPYLYRFILKETEESGEGRRFAEIFSRYSGYPGDVFLDQLLRYVPNSIARAEEFMNIVKDLRDGIVKSREKHPLPFIDHFGKPVEVHPMCGIMIDSFSKFETDAMYNDHQKSDVGDKSRNTDGIIGSRFKVDAMTALNDAAALADMRILLTGHIVQDNKLGVGKYDQEVQANQYLRNIKPANLGNQWSYLCSLVMYFSSISDEKNSNTKSVEYPRNREENDSGMAGDLKKIRAQFIRSKSAGNGLKYELMVSQDDGYLEGLSQYNMLREYKWGLDSNNWTVSIYPTAIQRTTARTLLEEDPLLLRAVGLSSNLLQLRFLYPRMASMVPTPAQFAEFVTKQGIPIERILETRENSMIYDYDQPVPFFSAMDAVGWFNGTYVPYWL